ncbi:DNA polymerase (endogenous virus) [Gutovirus Vc1]|uniref:DNA polymerase n=1 Tax=Vibrio phage Vc1 TaxID=1480731 RepID=X2KUJ0_9CAUD|nr:DNA polymerase [Vibrio phage Vc1]AHN84685.1 DNA polymerase [Vibrio phage Vc1]
MYPKGERPSGIGRFLVADMEGVGLLPEMRYNDPTSMHTICITDMFSGESYVFFDPLEKRDPEVSYELDQEGTQDGYLHDALDMLMEAEAISFQNMVGYDGLAFEKVFPNKWKFNYLERRGKNREHSDYFPCKLMDTMIISQLLNPDRKAPPQAFAAGRGNVGAHSIEAHGLRIGRWKPENEDWSVLTDHMVHRCSEDTEIGKDFFFWLMNHEWSDHLRRGRNPVSGLGIDSAYRMELQVAIAIARQGQRGWRLDMKGAWDEWLEIGREMKEVSEKITPFIPKRISTEPFKSDRILKTCAAYCKAFPNKDITWLRNHLQNYMTFNPEGRVGKRATCWKITTAKGDYNATVRKDYPEMVGNVNDTTNPLVAGAYTPIVYDDVGLGNLEYIKQYVLYPRGWLGVTFGEADEKWINNRDENPTGEPKSPWSGKIDEKSLKAWEARDGEIPDWLKGIVDWYVLRSRRSQILNVKDMEYHAQHGEFPNQKKGGRFCKGLLAKAYSKEHGMEAWQYFLNMGEFPSDSDEEWRVPAEAFSIGTNTFRMRHKFVVNIPSRGLHPLRHLFIASKGKKILGCDGAGLELRMLAHFMNDALYTEVVLNGDIHTHNQELAGLPIRDMAKTFIYAFLYGSGIKNLAKVCGLSEEEMEARVARFKAELPSLANLINACERAGEKYGYLQAIDGRWGRIRKSGGKILVHTVLNVLLQMTGSLCMKYGLCFAENKMLKEGVALDESGYPMFLANVHDEVQMEVNEDEVEEKLYEIEESCWKAEEKAQHFDDAGRMWSAPRVVRGKGTGVLTIRRYYHRAGEILAETMKETGEFLRMRIPLAGEYMIGDSWHDTH